ncbi:MAG: hypothetical protein HOQ45_18105 [Nocardioidaceae bacterium]|nr:hypothetical protein [Nocardioidaceae bacterium]
MTRSATARAWVLTRALTLVLLFAFEGARGVAGDITYFSQALQAVPDVGLAHTLVEDPLPAVGVVAVPMGLAALAGSTGLYAVLLVLSALVVDGLFTGLLQRVSGSSRRPLVVWLLAAPLLGGLSLARLDLLVGVLAAVGLLAAAPRPRVAAAAVTVATALKLWPVLLLPGIVAASRRRVGSVVVVGVTGLVLAAATLVLAGWGRLVSPLSYQGERGLHVESVPATPAMLGWAVHPGGWRVEYADSRAFEVTGPAVSLSLLLSTLLTMGLAAGFVLLLARIWRGGVLAAEGLVWTSLAAVCAFLATAKVFSPQYLLWLLPMAAAGLALVRSRALDRWSTLLLVATGLTHLVYPVCYRGLVEHGWQTAVAVPALATRNVLLVLLLVVAVRAAWRATSRQHDRETVAVGG